MGVAAPVGLAFALLVEFLEWLLISALIIVWAWTLGWLLIQIANRLQFRVRIPHVWDHTFDLGGPFRSVEKVVREALQDEKRGLDIEIAWTWNQLRAIWHATADALEWVARETDATFDWLTHVRLPKWAKWAAIAALPSGFFAKVITAVLDRIKPYLHKGTTVITQSFPTRVIRIVRQAAAGALTLPKWVLHIPRELRDIKADIRGIRKALRHPATFLGAAVMAGILANVLGVATRCIRRGNIGRTARRVCGMDSSLLDSLLVDGLAILGAVSVVEFAKDLQAIEDEAISVLGGLIKEWPS